MRNDYMIKEAIAESSVYNNEGEVDSIEKHLKIISYLCNIFLFTGGFCSVVVFLSYMF